jgi:hypothetical protein
MDTEKLKSGGDFCKRFVLYERSIISLGNRKSEGRLNGET